MAIITFIKYNLIQGSAVFSLKNITTNTTILVYFELTSTFTMELGQDYRLNDTLNGIEFSSVIKG